MFTLLYILYVWAPFKAFTSSTAYYSVLLVASACCSCMSRKYFWHKAIWLKLTLLSCMNKCILKFKYMVNYKTIKWWFYRCDLAKVIVSFDSLSIALSHLFDNGNMSPSLSQCKLPNSLGIKLKVASKCYNENWNFTINKLLLVQARI